MLDRWLRDRQFLTLLMWLLVITGMVRALMLIIVTTRKLVGATLPLDIYSFPLALLCLAAACGIQHLRDRAMPPERTEDA